MISQVFKQEGAADCYLFVKPGQLTYWVLCSCLEGKKGYLGSGRSGPRCVSRFNENKWKFNKADEDEERDWEEGGVAVHCAVHNA